MNELKLNKNKMTSMCIYLKSIIYIIIILVECI